MSEVVEIDDAGRREGMPFQPKQKHPHKGGLERYALAAADKGSKPVSLGRAMRPMPLCQRVAMTEGALHPVCTGLSHRTAPLDIREKVSFPTQGLEAALLQLNHRIGTGVILSTCNRTEIYSAAQDPDDCGRAVCDFLAEFHCVDPGSFMPHTYVLTGKETVRHMFRVASGLDSMILGEPQILGQVRGALAAAERVGSPGAVVSRLFQCALSTGRRVREESDIGKNALSAGYAGVRLATRVLGGLGGRSVLLVGAGKAGRMVASAVCAAGAGSLLVTNRTLSRADAVAQELQGTPVPFDERWDILKKVDVVISSTNAPGPIFSRNEVNRAMGARDGRPIFLFDLAVPRDIDPRVEGIPGVHLFNIDDLSTIADEDRLELGKSAAAAEVIVEEGVERFWQWWCSLAAIPLIREMKVEAEAIRCQELEKALRRLPRLDSRERRVLEDLSRSITNKLLHRPVSALKEPKEASHRQGPFDLADSSGSDPGRR